MADLTLVFSQGFAVTSLNSGLQALTATHQRKTLEAMMQASVKAKTEYTNIRTIASEVMGWTPGQAFQAIRVSQAKWTLTQYGTGD